MIAPFCDACKKELMEPGALAFSPPENVLEASNVKKYHICVTCWDAIHSTWFGGR